MIKAQPGPQRKFLSSPADIAIIGGGNDGGKTFALLMEGARNSSNPEFGAVYFRREIPQITHEGGLWEEAQRMFGAGCSSVTSPRHKMTFRSGATITFSHLQHESDKLSYDGAQIPLVIFDQLEQFTEGQFWHLLGRNRSGCGVKPYVRASFNPPGNPRHWLSKLIQWYWDEETGYLLPERSGVVRWFKRKDDGDIEWFNEDPNDPFAKSFTCILALIDDNKIALEKDPQRLANLMNLPYVERERRRYGNMKIEDIIGDGLIKPEWWTTDKFLSHATFLAMLQSKDWVWKRGWDLAAGDSKDADYTVGALIGRNIVDGRRVIADVVRGKWTPLVRNQMIASTIKADMAIEAMNYIWRPTMNTDMQRSVTAAIAGLPYQFVQEKGSKLFRAQSWSPQVEAGSYYMVEADWNAALMLEGAQFTGEPSTEHRKDDIVDAVCLADIQHTLG